MTAVHPARQAAIYRIKQLQNLQQLVVLEQDRNIGPVLAVWNAVRFPGAQGPPAAAAGDTAALADLTAAVWDGIDVPFTEIAALAGPHLPVDLLVRRIMSLGLAFPDGTLHPVADMWVAAGAHRVAQALQSKPKRG